MDSKRIIPKTKLHYFYDSLRRRRVSGQLNICENLMKNPECLLSLYTNACNDLSRYSNVEEGFVSVSNKRKQLKFSRIIKNTPQLLALFEIQRDLKVDRNGALDFKYIEREINPLRTTRSIFETGIPGSSSGGGGLDFIGINKEYNPVLGEVKIKADQNAFYAFIQLLTYCSELFTKNQIERINRYHLFGEYKIESPCNLYIVLHKHNPNPTSETGQLIKKTENLAKTFKELLITEKNLNSFQKVGCIACLETIIENGAVSFKKYWDV